MLAPGTSGPCWLVDEILHAVSLLLHEAAGALLCEPVWFHRAAEAPLAAPRAVIAETVRIAKRFFIFRPPILVFEGLIVVCIKTLPGHFELMQTLRNRSVRDL